MLSGTNFVKFCSKGVTAQWSCDSKLLSVRRAWKCYLTRDIAESVHSQMQAYVDPNMESIFKFYNLRFSPEVFCHISVIEEDCCIVAYGCFFLPEHLQCKWLGKPKVDAESSALFSLLMQRLFLFECVTLLAFSTFSFLLSQMCPFWCSIWQN